MKIRVISSKYIFCPKPTSYNNSSLETKSLSEKSIIGSATNSISEEEFNAMNINVFPNPASDLIAIQIIDLVKEDLTIELFDIAGKLIATKNIYKGTTIAFFETETLYNGTYILKLSDAKNSISKRVVVSK